MAHPLPIDFAKGRYCVKALLGEGSSKRVYLAHDTRLERDVAISLINTRGLDEGGIDRVRREAQAMARLGDHPHIVTIHDVGDEEGAPYIVSQYLAGGSLDDLLGRTPQRRLPIDQLLRIGGEICSALQHAHGLSIIHRDLKPSNVWLTGNGTAKLGDFGLAVALDRSRLTAGSAMVGTIPYMPPEQALGAVPDARSDLYSLGAMLYEMATGRPPFVGEIGAIIVQHINATPDPPSRHDPLIPRKLEDLILQLLAKTPEARPASVAAVQEALAAVGVEMPSASRKAANRLAALEGIPVTLLFTDLVGSTELLHRVGDQQGQKIFAAHRSVLKQLAERHSGHEVKWLGDGLMVAFPSATNAVQCAIEMQRAAREADVGEPLAIRIGLNVGEVLREEADYFGMPVVIARRLCDRARAGQILCSHIVAGLLAGRRALRFEDLGPVELKGVPHPVRVSEVLYDDRVAGVAAARKPARDQVGAGPLPSLLAHTEQFAFVGRSQILDRLLADWRQTATGGCVVVVSGEPGIGKTRLAAEVARLAHSQGAMVLYGRCDEEVGIPFQPFVEVLEQFLLSSPDLGLRERLGRHAGELVRLRAEIAQRIRDLPPLLQSDPETERYRLFDAVSAWLTAAAAERPIFLVIDDLHWAGKPTLLLLRHIALAGIPRGLMILCTHRDTEAANPDHLLQLLTDLRRVAGAEQIALPGLDESGVIEFVEAASGQVLDDIGLGFARAVHADTAGNPFFVGEVLRHLVESGVIVQRGGRWVTHVAVRNMGIPAAARDVILRRVRRLSSAASETLALAAVVGRDFDIGILATISPLSDDELLAALEEAIAARLVDESGVDAYRFTHALVRSALYDTLSASRRARLHRRVGAAIEVHRPGDVTALAYHFGQAGRAHLDKAIEYATRAGDQALFRLAHDQAVHFYQRTLELVDSSKEEDRALRCAVLGKLGNAQKNAGDPGYRETLLSAARLAQSLGDTEKLVQAALANNRGWVSTTGSVDTERVAILEAALAALEDRDSSPRSMLLATLAAELLFAGDRPRRIALSDQALAMARRVGDPIALAHVLNVRSHVIWAPETLPERLANTAEHVTVAQQLGDPLARWYASATRPQACIEAGDIAEVDRHLDILWELTLDLGRPHQRWAATIDRAWRELLRGRVAAAEALAIEACQIGTASGQRDALGYYTGQLIAIRFDQGRLDEMIPTLEEIERRWPGIPLMRASLALAYSEIQRYDEAQRILDARAATEFNDLPLDMTWLTEMGLCAEVSARLGARAPALMLYERLLPWPRHVIFNGLYVFGSVSRSLGLLASTLGQIGEAERHFTLAASTHDALGAPALLARTRLDHARILQRAAQPREEARARAFLDQSLEVAGELGLRDVNRQAKDLLAQLPPQGRATS